jgi:hypothetical protein
MASQRQRRENWRAFRAPPIRLRFFVQDPDTLFNEYRTRGVECTLSGVRHTAWGTRELALYDSDRNALTFYRHPTSAAKERLAS